MPESLPVAAGGSGLRRTPYHFPRGIPAFEHVTRFCLLENPAYEPLVVLEAESQPALRFACVPVECLMQDYRLELSDDEAALLASPGGPARLRVLAILTFRAGSVPTANLLAPVVLNPGTGVGVQSVQAQLQYSHLHPLREEPPCS